MTDSDWTPDDFANAANDFRLRWRPALLALRVSTVQLKDIVSIADPAFVCPVDSTPCEPTLRAKLERFHERFSIYPVTCNLASPFRPLADILDHGGSIYGEHGFIDIHDADGEHLGGYSMRSFTLDYTPPDDGK